ncbi:MAG: transglutaminase domain-containing protein, partial [Candidatus Riflebacteria bacterium]|nr:transglutaminase domain-containing protein [Candidatus Riflebacteria bacterium]
YEKRIDLTDYVKAKVDELVKDCKNINEKIAKLYYFCQQEIRYISIKSNLASNQVGHPADETLKNKYGDCTDKGMLLSVMLKHIGVEAYPVLILTNNSGKSVRELGIFDDNHCITEVHLDGRIFYLDATATDYRYPYFRSDDHETNAMNVMLGTMRTVPLPPPEDNASLSVRKIKLEPDGTTHLDIETSYNGPTEASVRGYARNLKPEEYEKIIRQSISALTADYELELATHTNPLDFNTQYKYHTKYTLNRYAPKSGKYMIFSVPNFELRFPEVSLAERKYPIQHTTSRQQTDQLAIKLPEGYTVKYLPPALRVQSPYVEFEIIYDQQGDEIDITRKIAFPLRYTPVEDYKAYKADLEKIAYSSKQKIFLEKVTKEESKETSKNTKNAENSKEPDQTEKEQTENKDTNEKESTNQEGAQK